MKHEFAEALAESGDVTIYEGYSGRGMFGEQTTAVRYDRDVDLLAAVCAAGPDWLDEVTQLRFDNLGRGYIAY